MPLRADFQAIRGYAAATSAVRVERSAPATAAQRGLWLTDSLSHGRNGYTVTHAYELLGQLDESALVSALQATLDRHDALRTRFELRGDRLWQIAADRTPLDYARTDLRRSAIRRSPEQIAADRLPEPLDLANGTVFRTELLTLSDTTHMLLLHIHHAVNDAASMAVIEKEISDSYSGVATTLTEAGQFWQFNADADDVARARAAAFWTTELAGLPLPADGPSDSLDDRTYGGAWASTDCTAEYLAVAQLAAELGVSPFAVLMTAMQLAVALLTERGDNLVGTTVSVRPPGFDDVVGPFVNTVPVRLRIDPNWTAADAVAATSRALVRILDHHEVPFDDVMPAELARRAAAAPAIPISLTSNTALGPGLQLPGLSCRRLKLESHWCQRDLAVYLTRDEDTFALRACRSTRAFSDQSVTLLLRRITGFLAALAACPQSPITELGWRAPGSPAVATAIGKPTAVDGVSPTLAAVRSACAEVLDRPEAGLPDDFFDAGGGSLAAMRLAVKLRLSIRQIFRLRSASALAKAIDERDGDNAGRS